MFFLSKLLDKKVFDLKGAHQGSLTDLVVSLYNGYPPVNSIIVKSNGKKGLRVPWKSVRSFEESEIFLSCQFTDLADDVAKEEEIYLVRDILDKQIIDTEGRKLIRVQDIQLARVEDTMRVMAVDISVMAILRQLGLESFIGKFSEKLKPRLIDWKNLSFLGVEENDIRLRIENQKLELLHPADIADIVSELSPEQRTKVLQALDQDVAADTIEELHPPFQANAIAGLESKRASEILEEMAPDKAADLIADLPPGKATELLGLMKVDEAYEIKQLLKFPENSAGGIMTTEYVAVPDDFTAEETIKRIREKGHELDTIVYIYVLDRENALRGVFSLKQVIMADPKSVVTEFMQRNVISVGLLTEQDEIAKLVSKYDILAVPVVDEKQRLKGIVTIDDALDVIIPTKWKKRFPRIY
jgi:magnesium transporter